MKTKLLLTTAMVAISFIGNVWAEDLIVNDKNYQLEQKDTQTFDKISVDNQTLDLTSNVNATSNSVEIKNDGELNLLSANLITKTFSAENSEIFVVKGSVLKADEMTFNNAPVAGTDNGTTISDFIIAGKNNQTSAGKNYLLADKINAKGEAGIGDDGINLAIEDGTEVNISGSAGIMAGGVNEDNSIRTGSGDLNINGGTVNISENGVIFAYNDVTINGGTLNLKDKAQIMSIAFGNNDAGEINFGENVLGEFGNFRITGGIVNVYGSDVMITGKDYVTIAGGELNIQEGAKLYNRSGDGETFKNTGFLVTNNGVMNVAGTLVSPVTSLNGEDSSPVAVGNGGILRLSSNTASIESTVGVLNKGTLDIGSYKPTVTGPVIFGRGGTLGVKVNSESEYGVLNADVIFKDGASVTISTDKSMKVGDKWKDVALINGKVAVENEKQDLSNGRFNIVLNNNGKFDIEYTNTARDRVAEDSSSLGGAADAWDGLDIVGNGSASAIADLLKELSLYNAVGYAEALKTLAPAVAPVVQQTQSETANQVFNAVGSRLSGGTSGNTQGMSSGDVLEDAAVWVQGLMNHAKLNKTSVSDGFKSDTYGTAMGLEKKISNDVKAGIGYAYSKTDVDAKGRDTDVKTHTALVYGEYKPSNWFVNGIMSYGWSDYDENKNVAGNIVKAKYDAETFGLQAMTGYDFFTKYVTVTPEMGLRYIHIKTDGYTDSAMQSVSGNDSDIITGVIGSRISKTFDTQSGLRFTPEAKLAMTYDLKHDNVTSNVTLPNGSSYSVNGKALDRFGVEVGGSLTAEVGDNVELSLGYEGKFREDYQDHSGLINFKYNF